MAQMGSSQELGPASSDGGPVSSVVSESENLHPAEEGLGSAPQQGSSGRAPGLPPPAPSPDVSLKAEEAAFGVQGHPTTAPSAGSPAQRGVADSSYRPSVKDIIGNFSKREKEAGAVSLPLAPKSAQELRNRSSAFVDWITKGGKATPLQAGRSGGPLASSADAKKEVEKLLTRLQSVELALEAANFELATLRLQQIEQQAKLEQAQAVKVQAEHLRGVAVLELEAVKRESGAKLKAPQESQDRKHGVAAASDSAVQDALGMASAPTVHDHGRSVELDTPNDIGQETGTPHFGLEPQTAAPAALAYDGHPAGAPERGDIQHEQAAALPAPDVAMPAPLSEGASAGETAKGGTVTMAALEAARREAKSLAQQLDEAQKEKSQASAAAADVERALGKAQADLVLLQARLEEADGKLRAAGLGVSAAEETVAKQSAQLSSAATEQQSQNVLISQLRHSLEEAKLAEGTRIAELQTANADLKRSMEEETLATAKATEEMQKRLDESERKAELTATELTQSLEQVRAENEKLRGLVTELQQSALALAAAEEAARGDLTAAHAAQLEAAAGAHKEALESLTAAHDGALKEQDLAHTTAVQTVHMEHEEALSSLRSAHAEEVAGVSQSYTDRVESLQREHEQALSGKAAAHVEEVEGIRQSMAALQAEHERLVAGLNEELAARVQEGVQTGALLEAAKKDALAAKDEVFTANSTMRALGNSIDILRDQVAASEGARDTALAEAATTRAELATAQHSLESAQATIAARENELQVTQEELKALSAESLRLRQELERSRTECAAALAAAAASAVEVESAKAEASIAHAAAATAGSRYNAAERACEAAQASERAAVSRCLEAEAALQRALVAGASRSNGEADSTTPEPSPSVNGEKAPLGSSSMAQTGAVHDIEVDVLRRRLEEAEELGTMKVAAAMAQAKAADTAEQESHKRAEAAELGAERARAAEASAREHLQGAVARDAELVRQLEERAQSAAAANEEARRATADLAGLRGRVDVLESAKGLLEGELQKWRQEAVVRRQVAEAQQQRQREIEVALEKQRLQSPLAPRSSITHSADFGRVASSRMTRGSSRVPGVGSAATGFSTPQSTTRAGFGSAAHLRLPFASWRAGSAKGMRRAVSSRSASQEFPRKVSNLGEAQHGGSRTPPSTLGPRNRGAVPRTPFRAAGADGVSSSAGVAKSSDELSQMPMPTSREQSAASPAQQGKSPAGEITEVSSEVGSPGALKSVKRPRQGLVSKPFGDHEGGVWTQVKKFVQRLKDDPSRKAGVAS